MLFRSSQRGTVSGQEWSVLDASGEYGKRYTGGTVQTTGTTPVDVNLPTTIGANKSAYVEILLLSRSSQHDSGSGYAADTTQSCMQKVVFMLHRGASGDCTLFEETTIVKNHNGTPGISGVTVTLATSGNTDSPAVRITGEAAYVIENNVSIVMRLI